MLDIAISITAQAFEGKLDKGGKPYILHCLAVMEGVSRLGSKVMQAAVMHDLVEDTKWTLDDLRKKGFDEEVVIMVDNVSHRDGETYDEFLDRIAPCPKSRAIKIEDLDHNSQIKRLKGLRDKDFERLAKYHI